MLLPQSPNIKPTNPRPCHDSLRLTRNRHINHLAVKRPRRPSLLIRLIIRNNASYRPLDLLRRGAEYTLRNLDLRGMNALLAVKPKALPVLALLLQDALALLAAELRAHQIDSGRQVRGARGRHNGAARIQELGQRGRACDAQIEREVLGREDETRKIRRGGADFAQICQCAGGLDERDELERVAVGGGRAGVAVREDVADYVGDEVQVGGLVDFGDDDGVDVWCFELSVPSLVSVLV